MSISFFGGVFAAAAGGVIDGGAPYELDHFSERANE
jgi:hypothetical protein